MLRGPYLRLGTVTPYSNCHLVLSSDVQKGAGNMNDSTLLLVDDESQIRRVLQAILCEAGYVVILAKNGQEGIDVVVQEHPDLVVGDLPRRAGVLTLHPRRELP